MDERQKGVVTTAMAKVLVITYAVIAVYGLLVFLTTSDIRAWLPALIILVAVPILVWIFTRNRKNTTFPMSIAGLAVLPDRTREAKIGRVKAYALDSLQYALIMMGIQAVTILWMLFQTDGIATITMKDIGQILLELLNIFATFFVTFFVMNYVIYEIKSRRYCKEHQPEETDHINGENLA